MHFQCYIHAHLTQPLVIINPLICHLNKLEVLGFIYYILVGKELRTCARALLFVHMRVRPHARALSISMPLPSTCSSLRLIHAELPRLSSALGGQTRRADGAAAAADTAGLDSSQSSSLGEAVWDSFSAR